MLAGGTGITPMYQTARAILKDPEDSTRLSLIYGNLSEKDILIKDLLDELMQSHPDRSVHPWRLWAACKCCAVAPSYGRQWTLNAEMPACKVLHACLAASVPLCPALVWAGQCSQIGA